MKFNIAKTNRKVNLNRKKNLLEKSAKNKQLRQEINRTIKQNKMKKNRKG